MRYLLDRGAQFVLCRHNKHPLWKRWQRRWPTLDEILSHWGPVGVVPASIKMTVLDADIIGNSACLETMLHRFPHVAVISSSKPYRGHVWIRDEIPRTNGKFACLGVKGDVRSGSGYAILWGDGATKLAAAMKADLESPAGKLHIGQMEEWILTQGGKLKTQRNPIRRRRGRGLKQGNHYRLTAGGMPRRTFLADARIGERNDTLFETLRIWAYGRRRGDDYAEWRGLVRDCADRLNDEIPEPLPSDEVGRTADSVADFCWTRLEEVKPRGGTVDRDVQARRGRKSGQARRWNSVHLRDDPKPWLRLKISRSTYYDRLKKFRDAYPDATGRPPDWIFRRCTAEEHRQQRVEAGQLLGSEAPAGGPEGSSQGAGEARRNTGQGAGRTGWTEP